MLQKTTHGSNSMKYSKNLLLLRLNLQKCCIGEHQVHLIGTVLEKNRKFRYKQLKLLQETEHFVLHNQNMLLKSTGQKLASSQNNLSHIKAELENMKKHTKKKTEILKTRTSTLEAEEKKMKQQQDEKDGVIHRMDKNGKEKAAAEEEKTD